jgi:hypothetical protein
MSNYSSEYREQDFCAIDEGLDYVFARMGAIYGAVFVRHWEGVDHQLVRQVWGEECGRMLTYKPKLDYALQHMNPDRPPSALAFKKLLNDAPRIPDKPHTQITKQPTLHELMAASEAKEKALAMLREITQQMRIPK